tara:strand:- start:2829 stop:3107 length:279 start_codon:yes stop_codon:yes gene_type:complete
MTNQVVRPVGKKLLIKEIKAQSKTASGIIIPEMAQKATYKGTVVGVGSSIEEISVGDIVQYAEHAMPTPMTHQGVEHLLVQEGDIFAIVSYE